MFGTGLYQNHTTQCSNMEIWIVSIRRLNWVVMGGWWIPATTSGAEGRQSSLTYQPHQGVAVLNRLHFIRCIHLLMSDCKAAYYFKENYINTLNLNNSFLCSLESWEVQAGEWRNLLYSSLFYSIGFIGKKCKNEWRQEGAQGTWFVWVGGHEEVSFSSWANR